MFVRELQGVQRDEAIAIDHTFAIIKNYGYLPEAKACFTMNTGGGEIAALALVENTAASQFTHLVNQMKKKRNFMPIVIYTDTWPHNLEMWTTIFPNATGRLGLFHLMKRIFDTLNPNCTTYWEALAELKTCLYRYEEEDEENLLCELMKEMTEQQIQQTRESKCWKQCYDKHLLKKLYPELTANNKLNLWLQKWKDKSDWKGSVGHIHLSYFHHDR